MSEYGRPGGGQAGYPGPPGAPAPFPRGGGPAGPGGRGGSGPRDVDERIGWREALASPVRFVAAALMVVVALAHALVTEDQFERATYLGVLFVVVAAASVALAVLLCWRDSRLTWLFTGLTAETALAVYVLAHSVGLPEVSDDVGRWTQPLAALSAITAMAAFGLAGWAMARSRPPVARPVTSRVPLVGGLVALQVGAVATFVAASLTTPAVPAASSTGATGAYWSEVSGLAPRSGVTRTYYIAADEVVWDYAPTGQNPVTGRPFDATAKKYVQRGPGRIGSRYLKCLYRGYTDGSFGTLQQRSADEAYLGSMGPMIRAAVGDTIKVVYKNNCRFGTSMHPHGVFYLKNSEGAPYADNTSGANKLDDAVPQGATHVYTWQVPERAGPGPHDGSSVMWMYHSHTDEVSDTYAGLMGPMVITSAAMARPDATPKDVDRELFILYSVMNENTSPYLETNVRRFALPPYAEPKDEGFTESNLMHSINGYVYGNQPMITIRKGQHVRWYVMGMGTEVDLHTPHWHGNTVMVGGMRMDTVDLLSASMVVADMVPDNVGVWLFHCHVNDHLTAGMVSRYTVTS